VSIRNGIETSSFTLASTRISVPELRERDLDLALRRRVARGAAPRIGARAPIRVHAIAGRSAVALSRAALRCSIGTCSMRCGEWTARPRPSSGRSRRARDPQTASDAAAQSERPHARRHRGLPDSSSEPVRAGLSASGRLAGELPACRCDERRGERLTPSHASECRAQHE
jgi:hypothetical protein